MGVDLASGPIFEVCNHDVLLHKAILFYFIFAWPCIKYVDARPATFLQRKATYSFLLNMSGYMN